MIQAVIFDCFGLFYVDPMKAFIESRPHTMQSELTDLLHAFDLGVLDERELVAKLSQVSAIPPEEVRKSLYGPQLVRNQALLEYVEGLRPTYKVGLLSNLSPHTMDKYFTQTERHEYFDDVVVSGEVGLIKPQPEIYHLACRRLAVQPAKTVFIDDTPANVEAAQGVGMHGITYTNLADLIAAMGRILQGS